MFILSTYTQSIFIYLIKIILYFWLFLQFPEKHLSYSIQIFLHSLIAAHEFYSSFLVIFVYQCLSSVHYYFPLNTFSPYWTLCKCSAFSLTSYHFNHIINSLLMKLRMYSSLLGHFIRHIGNRYLKDANCVCVLPD